MVSLRQHVGTPGYDVWIILGAWDQLGTTWDDMLSPKGSPKKPQRDHGLQQHVFYEGHEGDIDFDRIFTGRERSQPRLGSIHVLEGGRQGCIYIRSM